MVAGCVVSECWLRYWHWVLRDICSLPTLPSLVRPSVVEAVMELRWVWFVGPVCVYQINRLDLRWDG